MQSNRKKLVRLSMVCVAIIHAGASVHAEEEAVILPAIDVRSLLPEEVERTPGAATVLSAEEIEAYRPYSLHDAFDFVPGVRTIDDDVLGLRSGIGIRGAPPRRSRKTLLLEDGTAINASTYLDPSAHYTPPVERLEHIEVLKGAGQIMHGPLNNHGIINFRNRRPTPVPETTVELAGGNQSAFKRHVMHTRTDGSVGTVLSYAGMNADGTFDVEEHQYDDFYGSLDWTIDDRHSLATSLTYFRERSDGYDESNLTFEQYQTDPRSKSVLDEAREFNNMSVNYLKGDVTHNFRATDRLTVSTKVFATDLDRPRFLTQGTSPLEGGVMVGRERKYRTHGLESRVELSDMGAGAVRHTWRAGIRVERHTFDDRRPVGRPGEVLDEGNRGNVFGVAGADGYTQNGRLQTYKGHAASVFVLDEIQLGDWTVTPGIRAERFTQEKFTDFRPGSPEEGVREKDRNTLVLPGISVLYGGFDATQIYAGVHRGYAPASARTEEFPLTPETGVSAQVGVRSSAIHGVSLEAAAFYSRIKDTLIRDDVDAFGDALFINAADSDIYGLDLGARIDSAAYSGSAYNFFGQLAYNYTRARFRSGPLDGNWVPEIPGHAGSLTLGVDHLAGWHVSTSVSYFGSFYSDIENTEQVTPDGDEGRVPSRTLWSARASYTLDGTPHTTLWVQGRNLTDRLYISDVQDGIRPGAPRSVLAGVTMKF
jgi:Fe(3+) dicitrate transport protein